jgi:Uma2 family endonuclease
MNVRSRRPVSRTDGKPCNLAVPYEWVNPRQPTRGFFPGAPDLAVEVLSPDDRASDVLAKVQDFLDAGCARIWVVDPRTHSVTVYRSLSEIAVLREADVLTDDELLPGFSLSVAQIFRS